LELVELALAELREGRPARKADIPKTARATGKTCNSSPLSR
jgi:hypothetical protein